MSEAHLDRPSTPSLIGDAIKQATALFSAEVSLVRLEATEKLSSALAAVASIAVAAVFMIVALIFLLEGLVEFLVHLGWAPFAASFAIGGGILLIAIIALFIAARSLTAAKLKPQRTLREVKSTTDLAKGIVS